MMKDPLLLKHLVGFLVRVWSNFASQVNMMKERYKMLRGEGGLKAYLQTADAREIEKRIENGMSMPN